MSGAHDDVGTGPTVSAAAVAETIASATAAPVPLRRGATLGRYVVLEKLGGGGMGVVYTAYDPELDRRIAIKLLRPGASNPSADARTRLLREAQALARLAHPNVIAVHDVGVIDTQVFVAMEFVEGVTLHAWAQSEPRTWRAICDAYVQAGRGLEAAHAVGIVHRDFKPENVLVGNDGRVRVLDFGLAREDEAASRPDPAMKVEHAATLGRSRPGLSTPLTSAGEFLGTPAYSSPEQLQGDPADARSDQFSFCIALYEALYGQRPFRGSTFGELVTNVLDGKIEPPPARSRTPGRLREILLRGLRGDPGERYPSMSELLAALAHDPARPRRRVLVATSMLAMAGAASYAVWGRSHEAPAVCKSAAAELAGVWDDPVRSQISRAFLATGQAFAPGAVQGVTRMLDDYARHWTAMATDACEATHIRGEQSEELLDLREFCLARRRDALQALTQLLGRADAKIVQNAAAMALQLPAIDDCADTQSLRAVVKPPKDPAIRANVDQLERAIATARQLAEAEKLTEATATLPSLEAAQALHYRPLEASLLLTRGLIEYRATDLKRSVATLNDGIVAAEAAGDDKLAIGGWLDLTGDLADRHDLAEARLAARHASALIERIGGHPRFEGKLLEYQGWIEVYAGNDATPYFQRALDLRQRTLPAEDPDLVSSLEIEARRLMATHQFDAALAIHQRVLAARERLYGPDAPLVAWSLFGIASTQRKLGDEHGAIANLSRALAIYERADVKTEGPILFVMRALAVAHARLGEHDAALELAKRAVAIGEKLAESRMPADLAGALVAYAIVLRLHGDYTGAVAQAERALSVIGTSLPPDNGLFVDWLTELGLDRLGAGHAADAIEPLDRAVKMVEARAGAEDWNNDQPAQARFALARVLRALGKDEPRARELAGKAREFWASWGKGKTDEVAQVDAFLATASP